MVGRCLQTIFLNKAGFAFVATLLTGGFAASAFAYQSNQRNILPGGRPAVMGGAYTAVSDDPYGVYYNPAGIVTGQKNKTEVSASGNAFGQGSMVYKGAVEGEDFEEGYVSNYPTFIGGMYGSGSFAFAYSVLTLEAREVNQNDRYSDLNTTEDTDASLFIRSYQGNNSVLAYGVTGAFQIGNLALGTSVFYFNRNQKSMSHQYVEYNGGIILTRNNSFTTENHGLIIIGGAKYVGKQFNLGFAYETRRSASNKTNAFVEQIIIDTVNSNTDPIVSRIESETEVFDEMLPVKMSFGVAWRPATTAVIAADVVYYSPYVTDDLRQDYVSHYDYSLGGEFRLGDVQFRAGAFTNTSSYADITAGDSAMQPHVNYTGYSYGIGAVTNSYEINIGAIFQKSSAGSKAQILGDDQIQQVEAENRTILYEMKTRL